MKDISGLSFTVGLILAIFIGIPFISIVGLIISFFTSNKQNANRLSIIGYIIAAIPIWLYYIIQLID